MQYFSLSPAMADMLLNTVATAAFLTTLASLAICFVPSRMPRLRSNIIIGVLIALMVIPLSRAIFPQEWVNAISLRPAELKESSDSYTVPSGIAIATTAQSLPTPAHLETEEAELFVAASIPPIDWVAFAVLVWGVGAALAIGWQLIGWLRLRRLASALSPISDFRIRALWQEVMGADEEAGELLVSPEGAGLFTFGCRRPQVVVPSDLLARMTEREALSLLTHEWAHIRNHDALLGYLQRLVAAIYWWLPTVHWLNRKLSLCRETLADTAAAARVDSPTLYAHSVLNLAALACRKQQPATGAIGIAGSRSILAQRLTTLSKHYEQMKTNLQNPHPLRTSLAVLGLCSLSLAFQLTYAQDGDASSSASTPTTEELPVAELDPVPPQVQVQVPSLDPGIPPRRIAPAEPLVTPTSAGLTSNINVPKANADYGESPTDSFHKKDAELHRALAKVQRELARTQRELDRVQRELAKAKAEKEHFGNASVPSSGRLKRRFGSGDEARHWTDAQREIAKPHAEREALERHPRGTRGESSRDELMNPPAVFPQADSKAIQDQQRLLRETINQAVKEAVRTAKEEIRREFERKAPPSSAPGLAN